MRQSPRSADFESSAAIRWPAFPNSCKAATCSASACSSFFYTSIGSFVYFELKNLLADYDRETRSQIWASMDLAVNSLTMLVAAFATGRIAKHMGLPFTLASVPVLIGAGMLLLAAAPMVVGGGGRADHAPGG